MSSAPQSHRSDIYSIIAVLPFVAVCVFAGFVAAEQARTAALNEALGRARTAMGAVDAELRGHMRTIQAFATSPSLDKGDIRAVYDESKRVLVSQPAWLNVGLQSATGAQLFNAVLPFGSTQPPQVDQDSLERTLERGTPQIGNVAIGPAIDRAATRVRVPVLADGKVRYVVSVPLKPQLFEQLLREQHLPANFSVALLDGNQRSIAALPELPVGGALEDAPTNGARKARHAPEGFTEGTRADGTRVYSGYVASAFSGWTIFVSVPRASVEAAAWQAAKPIVIGLMAALTAAVFLVWLTSRRT